MDYNELKNKSEKELHDLLAETREDLRELKFKALENQLKNVRGIRKARKAVAQILTLLNTKATLASTAVKAVIEKKATVTEGDK